MITQRKILIVDDDDDLRQSLKEQLAMNQEFKVITAVTAAQGIDVVKNEHLDLVVLDVGLPDGEHNHWFFESVLAQVLAHLFAVHAAAARMPIRS
jgi:DNA-binding response OmpR family regulator